MTEPPEPPVELPDGTTVEFEGTLQETFLGRKQGECGTLHRYRDGERIASYAMHQDPEGEPYPDWVNAWVDTFEPTHTPEIEAGIDAWDALPLAERKRLLRLRELGEFGPEFWESDDVRPPIAEWSRISRKTLAPPAEKGIHYALVRASQTPPTLPEFDEWEAALAEYDVNTANEADMQAFADGFVAQWNRIFDDVQP
jgi:hypothetical protein